MGTYLVGVQHGQLRTNAKCEVKETQKSASPTNASTTMYDDFLLWLINIAINH